VESLRTRGQFVQERSPPPYVGVRPLALVRRPRGACLRVGGRVTPDRVTGRVAAGRVAGGRSATTRL